MAITLSLLSSGQGTVDLNDGGDGFQLAGHGWFPAVATPRYNGYPAPIVEVIHLRLRQTSHDNIATYMQALHAHQVRAEAYISDPAEVRPVWLQAKLDNETNPRRTLVRKIEVQYGSSWFGDEATSLDIPLTITIEREPYWESTIGRTFPLGSPAATAVVAYDYTAAGGGGTPAAHDIVGDTGARIGYFTVAPAEDDYLSKLWMGVRSANKHGSTGISNFVPIWELEDGGNQTDVTDTADATASGGNRITVSESAVNWDDGDFHPVSKYVLSSTGQDSDDQWGTFLWLLRGKLSAGSSTWEVQLRFGHTEMLDAEFAVGTSVEIGATGWVFKEMAVYSIPITNYKTVFDGSLGADADDTFVAYIWARRTSGAADLYLDCLCLVPVDEGFCHIDLEDNQFIGFSGNYLRFIIGQSPVSNITESYVYDDSADAIYHKPEIDANNFCLPPGDGRIYIVHQAQSASTIGNQIIINQYAGADLGTYYERWLSLRGAE